MPEIKVTFDKETNTLTFSGVDSHAFDHILESLLVLGGLGQSQCVVNLHNEIAMGYNAISEEIPDAAMAPVDQQAEKYISQLMAAQVLGLRPTGDEYTE